MRACDPTASRAGALAMLIVSSLAATGCANFSGVGGSSEYSCKAPEGVRCESVSGNYYNAIQNNLPAQRKSREGGKGDSPPASLNEQGPKPVPASQLVSRAGHMPTSLRAGPKVLRLWYKPWEDVDRDLNDQGYVYVQTEGGRWLIDHAQKQIRDAYLPVRPPRNQAAGKSASDSPVARPPNASAEDGGANGAASAVDAIKRNAQAAAANED